MVMMIVKTPSLNASSRPLLMPTSAPIATKHRAW
jgi:hypothetical protein